MKKRTAGILILSVLAVGGGMAAYTATRPAPQQTKLSSATAASKSVTASPTPNDGFDRHKYSITDSASIWVIANKRHPLSKDYAPQKLVVPAIPLRLSSSEEQMHVSETIAGPLESMVRDAKKQGVNLKLSSGYRSEALQTQFYNNYIAKDGKEAADRYSAIPGTSEHQTGLAVDMISVDDACHLEICFADTPEGKWLAVHAHEYGFIIRYLKDKESETTYQYEPWHIRYVGTDLAATLSANGQTMEAFFGYLD